MTTTPARMQQRRRTFAQWTSENPVLAAGEIGVITGGDSPGFIIGDGTTTFNNLPGVNVPGWVLTEHDAKYAFAPDMLSNGTLVDEIAQDAGLPRWTLADNVDQRVKWTWEIPIGWDGVAVRFGWTNETAGAGAVKFQFAYRLIYLGEGNVDTGTMTTISFGARTAGGQFDHTYETGITELASIATANGVFGDKPFMLCSLSRLGAGGPGNGDTLAGGASVTVTTATRIDL